MKKDSFLLLFFSVLIIFPISAQLVVGGRVAVDVDINLPIPDVVIERRTSKQQLPKSKRGRPIVIHRCDHTCHHDFGAIQNQNAPSGEYLYQVANASLVPSENGEDHIVYDLDTGDVLEIIIVTGNYADYNYHYFNPDYNSLPPDNIILAITFNGQEIPLHTGSISIEPQGIGGYHSVLNLHSIYEGNFNGTVNF
ncbi:MULTISPECIES: hypothetical protein [Aquimarina]|uniref:hypothetical protein n=1 Tax=Aquimarina TaxID=290174 RepID=UPI000D695104|nr:MULTISPECIES: hypothetical protein [Aquimarina]